jgi:hypothetical protein
MNTQTRCPLSQLTSSQLFECILNSGRITRADQNALLKIFAWENPMSQEDQRRLKQVFHRLDMGLLQVID